MHRLKYLKVVFNDKLRSHEIPAFRGAVAEKVGKEHLLFHQHTGKGYRYAYPLIQYKSLGGQPALICLGEGVEEVHHFFTQRDWSIRIGDRRLDMPVETLNMNQFTLQVWNQTFTYRIKNWIALNQENYIRYQDIPHLGERINFLEQKLIGNILSFAKGIGWWIDQDKQIKVRLLDLPEPRPVKYKQVYLQGFSLSFHANVFLPNYIGLGKGVSRGYGVVKQVKK